MKDDVKKDIFVIQLEIDTRIRVIETGYGVSLKGANQDREYFIRIGEKAGFEVVKEEENGKVFMIRFRK